MTGPGAAPLIVTLGFAPGDFERFDAMRRRHFPPERNHIPAHLTLFHALPGEREAEVRDGLAEAATASGPIRLHLGRLRFLGYGTAYAVEAPELLALRRGLAQRFEPMLGRQDASGFQPHVTIQNKAPAAEAKTLFAALQAAFSPFDASGDRLLLWRYRGGPWDALAEFPLGLGR